MPGIFDHNPMSQMQQPMQQPMMRPAPPQGGMGGDPRQQQLMSFLQNLFATPQQMNMGRGMAPGGMGESRPMVSPGAMGRPMPGSRFGRGMNIQNGMRMTTPWRGMPGMPPRIGMSAPFTPGIDSHGLLPEFNGIDGHGLLPSAEGFNSLGNMLQSLRQMGVG